MAIFIAVLPRSREFTGKLVMESSSQLAGALCPSLDPYQIPYQLKCLHL